jgi:hypothetical protein
MLEQPPADSDLPHYWFIPTPAMIDKRRGGNRIGCVAFDVAAAARKSEGAGRAKRLVAVRGTVTSQVTYTLPLLPQQGQWPSLYRQQQRNT